MARDIRQTEIHFNLTECLDSSSQSTSIEGSPQIHTTCIFYGQKFLFTSTIFL